MYINSIFNIIIYPLLLIFLINRYGFVGVPIAMVLSYWIPTICLIIYMIKYKDHVNIEAITSYK